MDVSPERREQVAAYYSRDDVEAEMVRVAEYREVAPTYPRGYGSRPDAVNFPGDFRQFVENGAVAFHGSVERWRNPLLIDDVDADDLRTGWDLVIDIDCDEDLQYAKITAVAVMQELRSFGIDQVSVKFSGNRGFHLGVRHEAFPDKVHGDPIADWYPALPQRIVSFLRHRLRGQLIDRFSAVSRDATELMEQDDGVNPYALCDIENDWGDRHLFRMPYSINEKSWLVSLPLPATEEAIMAFEKPDAAIDAVEPEHGFLDEYVDGEATELVVEALDWWAAQEEDRDRERPTHDGDFDIPDEAIPQDLFPPTIHNILDGLEDGRKRSLFVLITFLQHAGYDWESIEGMIWEWNDRNDEPLRDAYVQSQLGWHRRQDEPLMPPNWEDGSLYHDLGVYEEDALTEATRNPVSYAFAKASDDDDDEGGSGDGGGDDDVEIMECPYCGKEYKGETKWYRDHVMACDG